MKRMIAALAIFAAVPAAAEDYGPLRACMADIEATEENPIFHICTATLAQPCGASKTAAEAVACIDGAGAALGAAIEAGRDALLEANPEGAEDITWYLDETRANTEAQCETMAAAEKDAGLPTGQRAVNIAFCQLMATGDVFAALRRLEAAK